MKKTMLAICFMAMALTTVANEQSAVEDKVQVTAEVIQKLEITTTAVNFGKVAQGSQNNAPVKKGSITVTGHQNEKLQIRFADAADNQNWKEDLKELEVKLSCGENGEKLTYKPAFDPEENQPLALKDGTKFMQLGGTLNVPEDAEAGKYEGTMLVKVWYE